MAQTTTPFHLSLPSYSVGVVLFSVFLVAPFHPTLPPFFSHYGVIVLICLVLAFLCHHEWHHLRCFLLFACFFVVVFSPPLQGDPLQAETGPLGTLSGPVSRDTARLSQRYPPSLRAMGFWCLNMANWVRYTLPLFSALPPWRAAKWRCDTPPQKGYLSDTCAIPYGHLQGHILDVVNRALR